jgi:hypothetical protein
VIGTLNKQIARRPDIVERTVKAHLAKVMEKQIVDSGAVLVRAAESVGILPRSQVDASSLRRREASSGRLFWAFERPKEMWMTSPTGCVRPA